MKALTTNVRVESDFDLPLIFQTVATLKELLEQLTELYPKRKFLITQLGLTLMVKANHLTYGIYGSGKSELLNDLLTNLGVPKKNVFRIDMTRQTTESDVIGPIDIPRYREEGLQTRNPIGTIRRADYAELGEIFDAPMLLRTLLSILNERQYRRGAESEDVPLHAAFASTNVTPDALIKMYPDADAVVDRFLFESVVQWLDSKDDIRRMFNKFRKALSPSVSLKKEDMDQVSALITSATDQLDDHIVEIFIDIVMDIRRVWSAHKKDGWRQFSDRAFTQWLMVLEAVAIYNGHYKVEISDLLDLKYVACNGSKEQLDAFEASARPIVEAALKDHTPMDIDEVIMVAVGKLQEELNATPKQPADDQLVVQNRHLKEMRVQVAGMKAQRPENQAVVVSLLQQLDQRIDLIAKAIDGVQL